MLPDDKSKEEREQFQVLCVAIGMALSSIMRGSENSIERDCRLAADRIVDWMEK